MAINTRIIYLMNTGDSEFQRPIASRSAPARKILSLIGVLGVMYMFSAVAQDAEPPDGFGVKNVEIGAGVSPLGLTDENDLDSFIEYGGFATFIMRNPDDFMLRLSASYGSSASNPPQEMLSKGKLNLTRFDAYLLYGRYFYGGVGIGYYMFDFALSSEVVDAFRQEGFAATETFSNSLAYSAKIGVKSESKLGYFVEATLTMFEPEVTSSVTDLRTGNSAVTKQPFTARLIQFFCAGILYRF